MGRDAKNVYAVVLMFDGWDMKEIKMMIDDVSDEDVPPLTSVASSPFLHPPKDEFLRQGWYFHFKPFYRPLKDFTPTCSWIQPHHNVGCIEGCIGLC